MAREPLILLGGTFDPPHIGHLVLAEFAWQQLGGRVLFVPAGDPWRKAGTAVTAPEHRLAMTELATDPNPHFAVDAREVSRAGPTYTVETLEELRAEGHDRIVLVVGADALRDLSNWRAPGRIRSWRRWRWRPGTGKRCPRRSATWRCACPRSPCRLRASGAVAAGRPSGTWCRTRCGLHRAPPVVFAAE
jgi:cytidyltransferase-like protein